MKNVQMLIFVAFTGTSIAAQAADIPAQFRGQWGENKENLQLEGN